MSLRQFAKHLVILVGLTALPLMSNAGELGPVPPKAKQKASEKTECVEPVPLMRKNHMEFLKHKRDLTLREGVRTKEHSLVECIACHVTPNAKGEYPRYGDDKHFCSSCHNYAAVNVDCFDCHSDVPEDGAKKLRSLKQSNPHKNILTEGGKK